MQATKNGGDDTGDEAGNGKEDKQIKASCG